MTVAAFPLMLPVSVAVIVPALKLPEASRRTIWFAVFALTAPIVALFAWLVIVAALPVQEPDEPVVSTSFPHSMADIKAAR